MSKPADSDPPPGQIALFAETSREMLALLRAAGDGPQALAAIRWGWGQLEQVYASTPRKIKAQIACRAGCDFCCRVPMGVQAHEVLLAADYLQTHFKPEQIAETIERAAVHRTRVAASGATLLGGLGQACPLLREGRCSIYEARPQICRAHHASDAKVCEAFLSDPSVEIDRVYLPPLRSRMFAVMLGLDQGVAEAGFDSRAYDFGAALHAALTDSLCAFRWARKGPAFPDSCLEPTPPEPPPTPGPRPAGRA